MSTIAMFCGYCNTLKIILQQYLNVHEDQFFCCFFFTSVQQKISVNIVFKGLDEGVVKVNGSMERDFWNVGTLIGNEVVNVQQGDVALGE